MEIIAPKYITKNGSIEVIIQSNEALAQWQEIYIIDVEKVRHDLTFLYVPNDNQYVGTVSMNDYPVGFITIYARLRDEVFNVSALASKIVNILVAQILNLDLKEFEREVKINESFQDLKINHSIRQINISEQTQSLTLNQIIRDIKIEVK